MLFEKRYSCFEHSSLVHLAIVLTDHSAELGDEGVELIPPLFLGHIPGLPLGLILLILFLHVVSGHREGGRPTMYVGRLHHRVHFFYSKSLRHCIALLFNKDPIYFSITASLDDHLMNIERFFSEGEKES